MMLEGWSVTRWIAAALVSMTAMIFVLYGFDEESVRVLVRATARSSIGIFLPVFAASSLRRLWPTRQTRWLLRNRRYLGVGFAASHFLHLGALILLGLAFPDPFVSGLNAVTLVGGGLAYLFIAAMALTSTDRAQARLGRKRWRQLHLVGSYYIFYIFAQSYGGRAAMDPAYVPVVVAMLAALVIRFVPSRSNAMRRAASA